MSFGKLYGIPENGRTTACRIVAKANELDVELVKATPGAPEADYLKINQLGKIPTFVGANGFVLSECIAIAVYLASQNEETTLLGKTKQDYASILRWMSFVNQEVVNSLGDWFRPLTGLSPYNKKAVEDNSKRALAALDVLEKHLTHHTYLVGERLTLADIFCASLTSRGFQFVLDKAWRQANPATSRWYETVYNQPMYKAVVPSPILVEEGLKNVPPKKEEKAVPVKAAAKETTDQPEEEEKPAKKAKHPLESLGKPGMILDDWKRVYANAKEDTYREKDMQWFWENCSPEDYSIWRLDYKDNDKLSPFDFSNKNLIRGFFNRLQASQKYIAGVGTLFGVSKAFIIQCVFVVRGQDALAAFDVAPDWESYDFIKLDAKKPEDRKFVEDAWDKNGQPTQFDGKTYEFNDSIVFGEQN